MFPRKKRKTYQGEKAYLDFVGLKRVTFLLPKDINVTLTDASKDLKMSRSQLLREMLYVYLGVLGFIKYKIKRIECVSSILEDFKKELKYKHKVKINNKDLLDIKKKGCLSRYNGETLIQYYPTGSLRTKIK